MLLDPAHHVQTFPGVWGPPRRAVKQIEHNTVPHAQACGPLAGTVEALAANVA